MDEAPPPPYTPFVEPTAEKPIITLTDHSDIDGSVWSPPPPPPPRSAASTGTEKTRPVSWSTFPQDTFIQPAGVPYFPPPPDTDQDTKPAATLGATLSAPHVEPYFAPSPTSDADGKIPAQPYIPPSPRPRASSFAAPSASADINKADVQFAPPPNQQWLPSQYKTPLPTPTYQYQHQSQVPPPPVDYKASQPSAPTVPQFRQPYYNAAAPQQHPVPPGGPQVPPPPQSPSSLNVRPTLPPRPTSAPSVPQLAPQGPVTSPVEQMGDPLMHAATEGSSQMPMQATGVGPVAYNGNFDVKTSSYGKRFVSNMLVSRVTRATWQSTVSMAALPFHLSPWGDNNPVTLPNVRKRDVALAGLAYVGADALAPSALDASEEVIKWAGKFAAEQAADDGLEKLGKQKAQAVTARAGVASTQVRIHHKMIGEAANVSLWAARPAADFTSCAKGWFCPYLYASGRAPKLERRQDFALAQFWGPGLAADASVAPALLAATRQANETPLTALCAAETPTPTRAHYARAAVFFLGIAPFRTASAWSQARVPNQARLQFHLLAGVPVLVVPVRPGAPILAWGARTLREVWAGAVDAAACVEEVMGFLEAYVDPLGVDAAVGADWRPRAATAVAAMFEQALFLRGGVHILDKVVDPDRAGLVFLRF